MVEGPKAPILRPLLIERRGSHETHHSPSRRVRDLPNPVALTAPPGTVRCPEPSKRRDPAPYHPALPCSRCLGGTESARGARSIHYPQSVPRLSPRPRRRLKNPGKVRPPRQDGQDPSQQPTTEPLTPSAHNRRSHEAMTPAYDAPVVAIHVFVGSTSGHHHFSRPLSAGVQTSGSSRRRRQPKIRPLHVDASRRTRPPLPRGGRIFRQHLDDPGPSGVVRVDPTPAPQRDPNRRIPTRTTEMCFRWSNRLSGQTRRSARHRRHSPAYKPTHRHQPTEQSVYWRLSAMKTQSSSMMRCRWS
jgi:hypothetical protein